MVTDAKATWDCTARPSNDLAQSSEPPENQTTLCRDNRSIAAEDSPSVTGLAPSCPAFSPPTAISHRQPETGTLWPGARIDDFEILRVLGEGGFGVVYLARQLSLERQVALKVAPAAGDEGRSMALLEHPHIVQVFSETIDPEVERRLLCMQYVPGPTLDAVLTALKRQDPSKRSGRAVLEIVDRLTSHPAPLDPGALRTRDLLGKLDWVETVCWMGARLAEALSYAHARGVVHRDIKPANILINQYGQPMLVDFNLAWRPLGEATTSEVFGGTLPYMSPEHLDAFVAPTPASQQIVAAPADLYSLGIVLFEMLAGELPFPMPPKDLDVHRRFKALVVQRHAPPPRLPRDPHGVMNATLQRALAPEPANRYGDAAAMAIALEGCREYHHAVRTMPNGGGRREWSAGRPFLLLALFGLLPHVVGSVVNVSYNHLRIVSHLTELQQTAFFHLVLGYNLIAYSVLIAIAARLIWPVWRVWQNRVHASVSRQSVTTARSLVLSWPQWGARLACLGWLPGGILFPVGLAMTTGPIPWNVAAHLFVSFTLSGLIALTYSFLLVQSLVLCVYYPRLWNDASDFHKITTQELREIPSRLRRFQVLAGLIPLCGAALLIGIGPNQFTAAEYRSFRLLTTGLIALGMLGFHLAMSFTRLLSDTLAALAGTSETPDA